MSQSLAQLRRALDESVDNHQLRTLQNTVPLPNGEIDIDGRRLINFASNDYLGLSHHPFVKRLAGHYLNTYGAGACSSRLLSGNISIYERIEDSIAQLKGTESALIFSTGFQANSTIISTLARANAFVVSDRKNHASISHGLELSRGRWMRYDHNDLADLKDCLKKKRAEDAFDRWIVTESIFSMDGDEADIPALSAVAIKYGAHLYLDEAHSVGVRGPCGFGARKSEADAVFLGTFGKACGSFGAFIACSNLVKDYLVNKCPGLIYSTALPPPVLGAIQAAVEIIPTMDAARRELREKSNWLRSRLRKLDFDTSTSSSHIIPIVTGSNQSAMALAAYLRKKGIFAPALRPPTVSDGESRVRVSLCATHSFEQISQLVDALKAYRVTRHDAVEDK